MLPSGAKRIVYLGAERVGLACLKQLLAQGRQIAAVFTADESLRPQIADFVSFHRAGLPEQVPIIPVTRCDDPAVVERIRQYAPELIVVISWSQRVPKAILDLAPCVGLHYSLLPQRRGAAPLNWAIIDGLAETGLTLLYLDEGFDTGDMIAQRRFSIGPDDTADDLLEKLIVLAPQLLAEHIVAIEQGTAPRLAQNGAASTVTPRRRPADSEIRGTYSAQALYNFIRALSPPFPPAFAMLGGRKLILPSARWQNGKLWVEGYIE